METKKTEQAAKISVKESDSCLKSDVNVEKFLMTIERHQPCFRMKPVFVLVTGASFSFPLKVSLCWMNDAEVQMNLTFCVRQQAKKEETLLTACFELQLPERLIPQFDL